MTFTAIDARGNKVVYRDGKRYLWALTPILATIPMISLELYFLTGKSTLTTLIPFAFIFGVVPIMDALLGEDYHNPPAEVVDAMEADPYYGDSPGQQCDLLAELPRDCLLDRHTVSALVESGRPCSRRRHRRQGVALRSATNSATRAARSTVSSPSSQITSAAMAISASSTIAVITHGLRRRRIRPARATVSRLSLRQARTARDIPARLAARG